MAQPPLDLCIGGASNRHLNGQQLRLTRAAGARGGLDGAWFVHGPIARIGIDLAWRSI